METTYDMFISYFQVISINSLGFQMKTAYSLYENNSLVLLFEDDANEKISKILRLFADAFHMQRHFRNEFLT